jgi:alanyl-tRNA synthetase
VCFACGHRAIAAMHQRVATLDQVGATLAAGLTELPAAARAAVERLAAADKRNRELTEWALEGEAHRLLAEGALATVVRGYDGWPAQDLRTLAQKLVRLRQCVVLLGSRAEKAHLVFAQSDGLAHDLGAVLKAALAVVEGRGGGRGNVVQGGGERIEKLDEALASAKAALEAKP